MTSYPNIDSHHDNVLSAIELLTDAVTKYEGALMDSIAELAKNREADQIRLTLSQADRIKAFAEFVTDLKQKWNDVVNGNDIAENASKDIEDEPTSREVTARTTWKIAGNSVRIETERIDGPPYSNVFPLSILKLIASSAVSMADKNKSVKTSEVLNLLSKKIIAESDYKKTPRIPVYATFKVLVKENFLQIDENNSHKYLLAVPKIKADNWIEKL